ncbi:MAG: 30S ribosomal protein S24e [Candidatus Altiarchaeota archaeon]|nr:30S ribosomal protein S24e [Candidatus Altiarchaeota archaeon]
MEINLVEDRKNVLLKRREVKFDVTFVGATPTLQEIRSKIVAMLDSDKKLTMLNPLKSEYGRKILHGYAKVYDDEAAMKVEAGYKIKRNFEVRKVEGAAEAAAPAAAPAAEVKKEGQ